MRIPLQLASLLIMAGIQGCGSSATYVPGRHSTTALDGRTAASYRLPSLFFPLPADAGDEPSPSQFDVIWRVQVGNTTVTQITPFEQVSVDPAVARQRLADDIMDENIYVVDPAWGPAGFGSPGWGF
jgi:hypothetical protein